MLRKVPAEVALLVVAVLVGGAPGAYAILAARSLEHRIALAVISALAVAAALGRACACSHGQREAASRSSSSRRPTLIW